MRKLIPAFALSLSLAAAPALAGGLDVPAIEPQVVVQDTTRSGSHDWVVPLMLLALLAAR